MTLDNEKIYHQADNVLITSTRAELEGKTFVMANITSVSLVKVSEAGLPETDGCTWVIWLVCFIFITIFGLFAAQEQSDPNHKEFLIIGFGLLGIVLWFINKNKHGEPRPGRKAEYAVSISSASGETRAMQSTDLNDIEKIVAAIKQAVIDSGVQKVESVSSAQVANPSDDVLQKLQLLKSLLDSGILTPQEYETKKAEIISRM